MDRQIDIAHDHVEDFLRAVEKVNKRAKKLEVPGFEATQTGKTKTHMKYLLKGEIVKLGGYAPVATVTFDHCDPVFFTWPGESVPEEYLTTDTHCDHCGTHRNRKTIYILRHESGSYHRVGSTCVRDFIGHDPATLFSWMGLIHGFIDDLDGWGKGISCLPDLIEVLSWAFYYCRTEGYVNRNKAEELMVSSTSEKVRASLYNKSRIYITGQDVKNAKAAAEWAAQLPESDSEYITNIRTIAKDGFCTHREIGFAASISACYIKHMMESEAKSGTEHYGEIKDRVTVEVKLHSVRAVQTVYGTSFMHKFTEGNHLFVWWAKADPEAEVGKTYLLKGTIKKHDEFNGEKQTVMTRCSIEEKDVEPRMPTISASEGLKQLKMEAVSA